MRLYAEDTSTSMIHDANAHNSDYGEYTSVYSPRSDQLVLTQIKHTHTHYFYIQSVPLLSVGLSKVKIYNRNSFRQTVLWQIVFSNINVHS